MELNVEANNLGRVLPRNSRAAGSIPAGPRVTFFAAVLHQVKKM